MDSSPDRVVHAHDHWWQGSLGGGSLRGMRARLRARIAMHRRWILWAWSHVVVAGGTTCAVVMMALCAWSLYQSRLDTFHNAQAHLQSITSVVERDIERNFELYSLSLDAAVDGMQQPQVMRLPPGLQRQVLFDRAASAQFLGSMLILNPEGDIIIDSEHDIPRAGNFADRDYFQVQRENTGVGLYVSDPFKSRLREEAWTIAMSRRLNHTDGSFAGVATLSVRLQYFRYLFSSLNLGHGMSVTLVKDSGELVMREPLVDPSVIGQSFAGSQAFEHFNATQEGSFVAHSRSDNTDRLYAYHRLPGLPMIVAVASSLDDIYAEWWRRTMTIGLLMLMSGIGFVAMAATLGKQLRRRMAAEVELEVMARTDGLTGLSNRRMLTEILDREWANAHVSGSAFSLLFVDIDHFKMFNDTYGHQAGDVTLSEVARCIRESIRADVDSAARYGGEEFVIVLPDTGPVAANGVAHKVLQAIRSLHIPHDLSTYARVTASIGMVTWSAQTDRSIPALIKAADDALYRAKAEGRNRVVSELPVPSTAAPAIG
ncbi:diguanylate cyclase [Robbsia sp. KACC 23696]|uniref:GGDEF domain-containing protein n=1 Tax=Robbsia sp. KACC 23696 TaxID=3149231 RepID=UPI00325A4494